MAKVKRNCKICGTEFSTTDYLLSIGKGVYCSKKCYFEDRKPEIVTSKCPVCGKEFDVREKRILDGRGKHCSKECANKALKANQLGRKCPWASMALRDYNEKRKMGLIEHPAWNKAGLKVVCETCKREFDIPPARKQKARFCSRECKSAWQKTIIGRNHPLYKQEERICLCCGKTFLVKPAKIKYGEGKFCSRNCLGAYTIKSRDKEETAIEKIVAGILEEFGLTFERQKVIGHYVVDFFIPTLNLIVEADGDYWHNIPKVKEKDELRNELLTGKMGFRLLRLWESEIKENPREIIKKHLDEYLKQ